MVKIYRISTGSDNYTEPRKNERVGLDGQINSISKSVYDQGLIEQGFTLITSGNSGMIESIPEDFNGMFENNSGAMRGHTHSWEIWEKDTSVDISPPDPVFIEIVPSDNTAFVSWTPSSSGSSEITQFNFNYTNLVNLQSISLVFDKNQSSTLLQNLFSNTQYRVTISATNIVGTSESNSVDFTTTNGGTAPAPTPAPTPAPAPEPTPAPDPDYNFIIESDGFVRMFRIGAVEYTEIKILPDSVQSIIDRNIGRLLTPQERAIPYPREPTPEPTPAPAPEPEPTFCVNVYNVRESGSVYSTNYGSISAAKVDELQREFLVVSCEANYLPTEKQVQDFYGFTPPPPQIDTTINSTMISQSIGSFSLTDGRVKGEILYIANQSFNPFYYNKAITSLVQIKSKTGTLITIKQNNLNFTETERDERIQIDESVGNFKELIVEFYVWDSPLSSIPFSEAKQIQIIQEDEEEPTICPQGFHKDFSGKCVEDDPQGEIPRDKLIDTLKGFLFGTVALSLLARKY